MRAIERHCGTEILDGAFLESRLARAGAVVAAVGLENSGITRHDLEERYRSLAKMHHPDMGGDATQFARFSGAIEQARRELQSKSKPARSGRFDEDGYWFRLL
jgi:hypothetical protein